MPQPKIPVHASWSQLPTAAPRAHLASARDALAAASLATDPTAIRGAARSAVAWAIAALVAAKAEPGADRRVTPEPNQFDLAIVVAPELADQIRAFRNAPLDRPATGREAASTAAAARSLVDTVTAMCGQA